jgi:fluoroquinolone transport system permease protein
MDRVATLLRWDIRIQARYYIYAGAVFAFAIVAGMVAVVPFELPAEIIAVLILADSGVIAFFMVGVLILMEKSEGTMNAIGVTPTPAFVYVLARSASLAVLSVAGGMALVLIDFAGRVDMVLMFAALLSTSIMAVLWGFVAVAGASTVNQYFGRAIPVVVLLALPLLSITGLISIYWTIVFPSHAVFLLFIGAVETDALTSAEWIYAALYSIAWIIAGWFVALRAFDIQIVGDGK